MNNLSSTIRYIIDQEGNNENYVYETKPTNRSLTTPRDGLRSSDIVQNSSIDEDAINDATSSSGPVPVIKTANLYKDPNISPFGRSPYPSDIITQTRLDTQQNLVFRKIRRGDDIAIVPSLSSNIQGDDALNLTLEQTRVRYMNKSRYANNMSIGLKMLRILIEITIMILGLVVGILGINRCDPSLVSSIVISILGYVISAITAFKAVFSPEKRCVVLKQSAMRLRMLASDLTFLMRKALSPDKKLRILSLIEEQGDEVNMAIFDMDITTFKPPERTSIFDLTSEEPNRSKSGIKDKLANIFTRRGSNTIVKNKEGKEKDEIRKMEEGSVDVDSLSKIDTEGSIEHSDSQINSRDLSEE